jgi:hypothetical protein
MITQPCIDEDRPLDMNRITATLMLTLMLAACGDGQPFFQDEATTDDTTDDGATDGGTNDSDASGGDNPDNEAGATDILNTGTVRPPLAANLVQRGDIVRTEARGENAQSGGFVSSIEYDSVNDRLIVDGIGFDGANTYSRGDPISQLASYQVYEGDVTATDSLTGDPINQITPYRTIYGVSRNSLDTNEPRTSFSITRTGGYVDFGFGGYIYGRVGDTVLPTTGQAQFTGDYAGIRVFQNRGGLELTRGDVIVAIDLRDFNQNDAVRGRIFNRSAFNSDGSAISLDGVGELALPTISFALEGTGTDLQDSGEFSGELRNARVNDEGALEEYETGNYYAILSGDATDIADGGEVVGVFVVESEDPRYDGVIAQETGGFIAYR